jgi:hypothetical protein
LREHGSIQKCGTIPIFLFILILPFITGVNKEKRKTLIKFYDKKYDIRLQFLV